MGEILNDLVADSMSDEELLAEASRRGYIVHMDDPKAERHITLDAPKRGKVRIGFISDTHFGSKYQQPTHLRDFAKKAAEFKVDYILHAGDALDGTHKMHRGMEYEQFVFGHDGQAKYAAEHWPEVKVGKKVIPQAAIGGNHDGSFFKDAGANVFEIITSRRDDITFLGAPAATFHISGLSIYLVHPDGGISYARSYKAQKAIEQLPPGDKPHLWVAGHWHTQSHLPAYRGVEGFSLASFQATTPYLMRKGLISNIGGLLLELEFSELGLEDLTSKWVMYRTPIEKDW